MGFLRKRTIAKGTLADARRTCFDDLLEALSISSEHLLGDEQPMPKGSCERLGLMKGSTYTEGALAVLAPTDDLRGALTTAASLHAAASFIRWNKNAGDD